MVNARSNVTKEIIKPGFSSCVYFAALYYIFVIDACLPLLC